MAKQLGMHKLRGKVDEQTYYLSKNGGYLSRRINLGMSERVKTDPAFENTRLNASEFGGAGMLAGALVRPVSQRWRFILNSIATGLLTKVIDEQMRRDTTHPFGQREITATTAPVIMEKWNSFSKNPMPNVGVRIAENIVFDMQSHKWGLTDDINLTEEEASDLRVLGINSARWYIYNFATRYPKFNTLSKKYSQSGGKFFQYGQMTTSGVLADDPVATRFSKSFIYPIGKNQYIPPTINEEVFGGVLIIMLPYETINRQEYVQQEKCAALWMAAKEGQIE